ncbi:MAG: 4Fe-4S binding protein [Thermodesulfobacteriota bacterium]|nr:4Fe-4S binding protein [Thermodesulfobacteriota bacterium]
MSKKDFYDVVLDFYELTGKMKNRDEFKKALQLTIAAEDLEVFSMLPLSGNISFTKLLKKSKIPLAELRTRLKRLAREALIMAYKTKDGLDAYERGNPVFMTEQQVRKKEDTPQRAFFAGFFNTLIEGELGDAMVTKTPYYRVLPAEPTIIKSSELRTIDINVEVPNPSGALPIDIITEMIKKDGALIGVADCFCRKARRLVGKGCDYPLETCFVFNELAQTLIENGFARKIDYDETIEILKNCESLGLVHNVDNCGGQIRSLCNCCPCCCVLLASVKRGETNADAPSRYVVDFDPEKCINCEACISRCPVNAWSIVKEEMVVDVARCIGCGLCVTTCPTGAGKMVLREKTTKIPKTLPKLYKKLGQEILFSLAKRKIFGE